jgi:hypothetical protein
MGLPRSDENVRGSSLLTLETPQSAYFVALQWMNAWGAALGPADVHAACPQFNLVPLQVAQLRGPQAVPEADQDHGGVAVPIAAELASRRYQALHLAHRQILPGPN